MIALLVFVFGAPGCARHHRSHPEPIAPIIPPLSARTESPTPRAAPGETGIASWYGNEFHGRPTASGEAFDQNALTASHRTLPFGTMVNVTNLDNGRSVVVRINDRGPHIRSRIVDVSKAAARELEMIGPGLARVRLDVIESP